MAKTNQIRCYSDLKFRLSALKYIIMQWTPKKCMTFICVDVIIIILFYLFKDSVIKASVEITLDQQKYVNLKFFYSMIFSFAS